jgi:monoamine oxidase
MKLFGERAARPIDYIEGNWSADPWTRGCYAGIPAPGAWVGFGPAWREPIGNIHWAGAEYASHWNGFMEGAVLSGESTAAAILQ